MLANIKNMFLYFGVHYNDIIVAVVIMVSAIIAAIGILKPIIFDKIPNKDVRKVALAGSNVVASFLSALVYFLTEGWDFKYFGIAGAALAICCIVTYWLYENTCLRNLITIIGSLALRKVFSIVSLAATTDDVNAVKAEINNAKTQLKTTTKSELKKTVNSIKADKDLRNL